jgi:hypothetical protein
MQCVSLRFDGLWVEGRRPPLEAARPFDLERVHLAVEPLGVTGGPVRSAGGSPSRRPETLGVGA